MLLLLLYHGNNISFRILKTSILHFFPSIKLHHIILLSENPTHHVYTLDFTPINQTNITTLVKLLVGKNVDAEVRLRYIQTDNNNCNGSVNHNNEIDNAFVEKWNSMNNLNEKMSKQVTKNTYNNIKNKHIQHIIKSSFLWREYMNLYYHNCQHFSKYMYKIYLSSTSKNK